MLPFSPQECVANLHVIMTTNEERCGKELVGVMSRVALAGCCGLQGAEILLLVGPQIDAEGPIRLKSTDKDNELERRASNLAEAHVQSSAFIRGVVLSRLFSKLCEVAEARDLHMLLLLASVVARLQILT